MCRDEYQEQLDQREQWLRAEYCSECGNSDAPYGSGYTDDDEPGWRYCAKCWRKLHAPKACMKCRKYMTRDHSSVYEYCPSCMDNMRPGWRDKAPYIGLYCLICGAETGNTDMCVECMAWALSREERIKRDAD